jgi:hypothetical protein
METLVGRMKSDNGRKDEVMMVGLGYLAGNFAKAVDVMATSTSDLRKRILVAAIPDLVGFQRDDFSDESDWSDYEFITSEFGRREPSGELGSIETSLRAMSDDEVVEVAKRIRSLEQSLRRKALTT